MDPRDLPYKNASDELGLPVYTRDSHLEKMGAPVLSLCIDFGMLRPCSCKQRDFGFHDWIGSLGDNWD